MKLTRSDWFDGLTKPARAGVYERIYPSGVVYFCLWDGIKWSGACRTVREAADGLLFTNFVAPWRGLAEKPQ